MLLKGEKYGGQKGPNITGQNIFIAAASETMPIKKKKKNTSENLKQIQKQEKHPENKCILI